MNKDPVNINDSETILKDKFLMAGLVAVTGNLTPIVNNLLDMAKKEFSDEVNASFSVSDIIDKTKGEAIFDIYEKYFTINKDEYNVHWFLSTFIDPTTISINWIESKKGYLLNKYADFSEQELNDKDYDLIKNLYLVLILHKHINEWYRDSLTYLQPHYFTSGRKSRFYKDKKTRKLLSLEKYLYMLSDFDKKLILNEAKATYEIEASNMSLFWAYRNAFSHGLEAVNKILAEFDEKENF